VSKRIDRTIKNWRWWLILPATPLFFLVMLALDCARLVEFALSNASEEVLKILGWVRKGGDR
jgi:hypothetical protein